MHNLPQTNDQTTEQQILAKGLTAPRVTPADLNAAIKLVEFHRLTPVLTMCVITLQNGFTVTGESACVSPENYDQAIGEKIARENAVDKIWPLLGYALREKLVSAGPMTRALQQPD